MFWILLITAALTFSPALFNEFLGDDFGQIVENPLVHSLSNIPAFFAGSTFFAPGAERLFGIYYKPVMTMGYALIYAIFGANPWAFHLIQIILHAVNAYLAYRLFRHFFPTLAGWMAVLFLVHPINVEAVAYIANLQDILFVTFGLVSVNLYLGKEEISGKRWAGVGAALLLSLFSKETGILFVAMGVAYFVIFSRNLLGKYLAIVGVALAIYAVFRFGIAGIGVQGGDFTPVLDAPLSQRVINIPNILWYYTKTLLFPAKLGMYPLNLIGQPGIFNFALPALGFAGLVAGLASGKKTKTLAFFGSWVILGIGAHLQIFPLDALVADRWFYFPFLGVLGIMGEKVNFKKNRTVTWGMVIFLVILAGRSFVRTTDFKNGFTLTSRDIQLNPQSPELQGILGVEYLARGENEAAIEHLAKSTGLFPKNSVVWYNLAVAYQKNRQPDEAIGAYEMSIETGRYVRAFENLARLQLALGKYEEAINVAADGVRSYPGNQNLVLILAIAHYKAGDYDTAVRLAQELVRLEGSNYNVGVLDYIQNRKPITIPPP